MPAAELNIFFSKKHFRWKMKIQTVTMTYETTGYWKINANFELFSGDSKILSIMYLSREIASGIVSGLDFYLSNTDTSSVDVSMLLHQTSAFVKQLHS